MKSRLEWKVGLFVLISLVFAAGLIMKFSKSASVFTKTYEILLVTSNVGGIRAGASVLMAGVQVGTVRSISLDQSGKIVTMHVQVLSRYRIRQDARFTIEQAGFLGDQYISVAARSNQAPEFKPGETARCEEPLNFQEVARTAAGLMQRIDQTAAKLNEAVGRIDSTILSEQTLTNLSALVANFRVASERALTTLHGVDELLHTNATPLNAAIGNLVEFSTQLDAVAAELHVVVATNRVEITSAIRNLEAGTARLNDILMNLQKGQGLAGSILKDEDVRLHFSMTMSNLAMVSSNLSAHGLLWRPKTRRVSSGATPAYSGKMPSR